MTAYEVRTAIDRLTQEGIDHRAKTVNGEAYPIVKTKKSEN